MTLMRKHPSPAVNDFQHEINRMFDQFFGNGGEVAQGEGAEAVAQATWRPRVDISEDKDNYFVHAELPGLTKDDVKVHVENNQLVIEGERQFEETKDDKERNYHRVERAYGHFHRSFRLPENTDLNKIDAKFNSGVLDISIPKTEESKPKQIDVKVK